MPRPFAWIAGAAGGLVAYRLLRGRRRVAPAAEPSPTRDDAPEADPRAAELRARLDEARRPPAPPAEPADTEAGPEEDPDERRRDVHERGRAAIEEMRGAGGASEKP